MKWVNLVAKAFLGYTIKSKRNQFEFSHTDVMHKRFKGLFNDSVKCKSCLADYIPHKAVERCLGSFA